METGMSFLQIYDSRSYLCAAIALESFPLNSNGYASYPSLAFLFKKHSVLTASFQPPYARLVSRKDEGVT
jgi:hypothetical protein